MKVKVCKIVKYMIRLFKYYFLTQKKLEKQWDNANRQSTKWLDAEIILAYKAGWVRTLK